MADVPGNFAMREKREHHPTQNTCQTVRGDIREFPGGYMGVSLNGGTPISHPK